MKLSLLFFIAVCYTAQATPSYAQATKISLVKTNVAVKEIIDEIESTTEFKFLFNTKSVDLDRRVSLNVENVTINIILDILFKGVNTTYEIDDRKILLTAKEAKTSAVDAIPDADVTRKQITGIVTDENKSPLPGVTVSLKATSAGTVTGVDGRYAVEVPDENAILVFSFIGYRSEERPVSGRSVVDVSLEPNVTALGEVLVVGYGTQKKSDITGSIASVSEANIKERPYTSADQALQGQVAGVQMTQTSSAPGGNASVRIRGGNSISAGNEPLYVIDGFPIYNDNGQYATGALSNAQPGNVMASINPSDIASIEILKDASATAIYGSRGANGVVIITTKRGKFGQSQINLESYYGFQQVTRKLPLLNDAPEFARLYNEQQDALGRPKPYANPSAFTGGTDWQDAAFRTAPIQNYQLSFSGGDDKTKYYLSGNYFDQDGIVLGSEFNRGSIRLNLDRDITAKLKIGTSINISRTSNSQIKTDTDPANNGTIGTISQLVNVSPTELVYGADGKYSRFFAPDGNFFVNPIANLLEVVNTSSTNRVVGNAFAEYEFTDGLVARVSLGGDQINVKEDYYQPASILDVGAKAVARQGFVQSFSWLNENTLTYKKIFAERHSLNSMIGFTRQHFSRQSTSTGAQGFVNDILEDNSLNSGTTPLPPQSNVSEWALESYIGRINYGYQNKYLLTLTGRVDGSSRFGANNKYSFFPSGSLAWRVSEESFMSKENQRVINDLKLRVSLGRTGNQEIPQYRSLAALGNSNYPFGNVIGSGITPNRVSNPDLRWETTTQFDIGIDAGFFLNRLQLTADFYHKRTSDLLIDVAIPANSGFQVALQNVGSVQNQGIELGINSVNLDGAFNWTTSFNITFNRNEVLDLGGDFERPAGQASTSAQLPTSGILRVGEPVGSFFGYVTDGLFQSAEEVSASGQPTALPGDRRYKDINNDGIINASDRTILGYAQPDFFYGFTNRFSYKGVDLSVFFQGVQGNSVLNLGVDYQTNNNVAEAKERWSATNTDTDIPRRLPENRITNKMVEDGSFLRLRNITLGYNLPEALTSPARLRSVRIYASAQNIATFTNYRGYDPEVSSFGQDNLSIGVDRGGYPVAKTFTFGINIGL